MKLTNHERLMWAKGFVSCRMAADKMGVSVTTVHRLIYDGRVKGRDFLTLGKTKFIRLTALVATQTPETVKLLGLDDWSHVDAEGPC